MGRHERYTFDGAENHVSHRLTDGKVPQTAVFAPNASGRNQVAPIGGPWLEWDDNGNLTRKGDFHYKWDFRNRLVRVTRDGVGEIARYEYDAFDRRVVRTVESVEHQTSWAGWQALETRKAGALVDRRVYGVGLDEVVAIGLDVTGDGAIDGAYVPLYDSSGNVAVLTGSDGRVVERYDYRAFGPRETRVDSVRPQLTRERIASSSFELRFDEPLSAEVLFVAIEAGKVRVRVDNTDVIPQPGPTIQWADPELGGLGGSSSVVASKSGGGATIDLRLDPAGFRTLLVTFAESPDVGTPVELILDPGVIEDYYNNATTEPTTFSFTWPATDTILNDTRAPRLDRASVIEGCVELVFDEEIDPATWSAATIDQGAVDWASCEDGFGLCQQTCLATGAAHTLELGATLADLAGNALDGGAVGHGFDLSTTDTLHIWRRPDPRLLTSATGSVVDKSVSSAVRQALGFHGLPIDPETGLVYVRHRYYDPEMGRFLSQDPLGYVDGGNLYQYGLNNPGDLSDPLGLMAGRGGCGSLTDLGEQRACRGTLDTATEPVVRVALHPRVQGGLMAVGGAAEMGAAAFATVKTVGGAFVPASVLWAHGVDNLWAGSEALISGGYPATYSGALIRTGCASVVPEGLVDTCEFGSEAALVAGAGAALFRPMRARSAVAGVDGSAGGRARVWRMRAVDRGIAIEADLATTEYRDWYHIGAERRGFFELVDFQRDNVLVSLKSVDTRGKAWFGRMESHIDELATRAATVDGVPATMVLDLRVQPGGAGAAEPLVRYGRQQGVVVRVAEYQ